MWSLPKVATPTKSDVAVERPPRVRDQAPSGIYDPDGVIVLDGRVLECPACGRIVWDSNARLGTNQYIRHRCKCNQVVVLWGQGGEAEERTA